MSKHWIDDVLDGEPKMLTVEDVQRIMRIGRRHVYRLCADRRLHAIKTADGGKARLLIPRDSLKELLRKMNEAA